MMPLFRFTSHVHPRLHAPEQKI
jgi:hypothetical protein